MGIGDWVLVIGKFIKCFFIPRKNNESGFLIPKDNIEPILFNSKYIPDLTKNELKGKKFY